MPAIVPSSSRRLSSGTQLFLAAVALLVAGMILFFLCILSGVTYLLLTGEDTNRNATPTPTTDPTTAALVATVESLSVITPTATISPTVLPPVYPASCVDVRHQSPEAPDGDYTLYYGGVPERPFLIYCHNMASSTPAEYLTLVNASGSFNYSLISYPEGAITTHYQKLRINPSSLIVDRFDRTFATNGDDVPGYFPLSLDALQSYPVTVADYAFAESCNRGDTSTPPGQANIDLTGTSFVLSENWEFFVFGGTAQDPQIQVSEDRRTVNLSINGRCASIHPTGDLALSYVLP